MQSNRLFFDMKLEDKQSSSAEFGINTLYQFIFNKNELLPHQKLLHGLEFIIENPDVNEKFRVLLRSQNLASLEKDLFENDTDELDEDDYLCPSDTEILHELNKLNAHYQYFKINRKLQTAFISLFKGCKLMNDFVEHKNDGTDKEAFLNAYKILVLFGDGPPNNPFSRLETYMKTHNFSGSIPFELSKVLEIDLPVNATPVDLQDWQSLIAKHGPKVFKLFKYAPLIQDKFHQAPKNYKEALSMGCACAYEQYKKFPEFAEFAFELGVPEASFNLALSIDDKRRQTDNLPDVTVFGSELGQTKFAKYVLVKMSKADFHTYFLGELIDNCLSIGKEGQQYIEDAKFLIGNGFYALVKAKENKPILINGKIDYENCTIAGGGYAWLSEDHNLTIDDWRNLRPEVDDEMTCVFLHNFGKQVTASSQVIQVTLGTNGASLLPKYQQTSLYPEIMNEGFRCPDSMTQATIYIDMNKVIELRKEALDQIIPIMQNQGFFPTIFDEKEFKEMLVAIPYTTSNYLVWLKKLFTEQNSNSLWAEFIKIDKKTFFAAVQKNPIILKTLSDLKQMDLLNFENLTNVIHSMKHINQVNYIFHDLKSANLLNKENVSNVFKYVENLEILSSFTNILRSNNILTNENLSTIFNHLNLAHELVPAFVTLSNANISEKQYWHFVRSNPKHALNLSIAFSNLKKAKLLNDELSDIILKDMDNALNLSSLIISLRSMNLDMNYCPPFFKNGKLLGSFLKTANHILVSVKGDLQPVVFELLLQNLSYLIPLSSGISKLLKKDLLTKSNLILLSKTPMNALEKAKEIISQDKKLEIDPSNKEQNSTVKPTGI